jgi:hypothetical protein
MADKKLSEADQLRPQVQLTAAEAARSDSFERSTANVNELLGEIKRTKDPSALAILNEQLKSIQGNIAAKGSGDKDLDTDLGDPPAVAPLRVSNGPQAAQIAPQRADGWPVLPTARGTGKSALRADGASGVAESLVQGQLLSGNNRSQTDADEAARTAAYATSQAKSFSDVFQASRHDPRDQAMFTLLDKIYEPTESIPPGWSYMDNRDEIERNKSDDEIAYLRENVRGPESLARANAQLAYRRDLDETYGNAAGYSGFLGRMAGGLMDPVAFAAGAAAGKPLQWLGLTAKLANGGRVARTAGFALEGAVGNVAVEGVQDAFGEVKTSADYAAAAGLGAAMMIPFGALSHGAHVKAMDASTEALAKDIKDRALQQQVGAVDAHARATGETDGIKIADAVQADEHANIRAAVDDATQPKTREQLIPEDVQAAIRQDHSGELPPEPKEIKAPKAEGEEVIPPDVDQHADTNPAERQPPKPVTPEQAHENIGKAVNGSAEWERSIPTGHGNEIKLRWKLKKEPVGPDAYTAKDMLEAFESHGGTNKQARQVAKYLLGAASKDVQGLELSIGIKHQRGAFHPDMQRIDAPSEGSLVKGGTKIDKLKGHLDQMSRWHQETVLHEITHAMTHSKIQAYLDNGTHGMDLQLKDGLTKLQSLFNRYKEFRTRDPEFRAQELKAQASGLDMNGPLAWNQDKRLYELHYAGTDLHEFVAQGFTSMELRNYLRNMPGKEVSGRTTSGWKNFIEAITKMVTGKQANDAYTELTGLVDRIISADGSNIVYRDGVRALNGPMPSAGQRKYAAQIYQHAKQWVAQNPIDTTRLRVLTDKIGGLSDGLVLAKSNNPILNMVAGLVTETTTGAAGRKTTAAIRAHLLDRKFIGNSVIDYQSFYAQWRKANGGTTWDEVFHGNKRREFDVAVYEEILNRRQPGWVSGPDKHVSATADSLEQLFERARKDQIAAGVLGADGLPGSSKGYISQALDGSKLQALDVQELHAFHNKISEQLQKRLGWDQAFADLFAPHYTDRIRKRSQGSKEIDGLSAGGNSSQIIRDTLDEMAFDPTHRDKATAAANRMAGQGQTKARLDFDLREEYLPGKKLMDLYVTDPLNLARQYSRRTAGNVALTENGILGIRGVRELREAAAMPLENATKVTLPELEAYDRVMAEMLGTPVAGRVVSAGASNLQLLVGLQRLGGLVFSQAAEGFQLIHHVGFGSALRGLTALPRMAGEVGRLKKGQPAHNHILTSVEVPGGEFGLESYKMVAPLDAPEARLEDYAKQAGLTGRLLRGAGHLQSKISGFRALMAVQHRATAEQIVLKAMRYVNDGKNDIALKDMGFTDSVMKSLKADLPNIAVFDNSGGLVSLDLSKVRYPETAEAFIQAVHRGTSQIIQGTFIGERNKWVHNDWLRLMLQLRTFGLTATEKQFGRTGMNHGYTTAAMLMMGQMAMAAPLHYARIQMASVGRADRDQYIKDNLSPAAMVRATMNYASLTGSFGDVLEILTGIAGGWGDSETKELLGARNSQQATSIGRLIPAAGSIDSLFKAASGKSDLHTAIKQLPFSNLWYLNPVISLTKK